MNGHVSKTRRGETRMDFNDLFRRGKYRPITYDRARIFGVFFTTSDHLLAFGLEMQTMKKSFSSLISRIRHLLLAGVPQHDEMCPSRSEYFGRLDWMRDRLR